MVIMIGELLGELKIGFSCGLSTIGKARHAMVIMIDKLLGELKIGFSCGLISQLWCYY